MKYCCEALNGIDRGCSPSVGGIQCLWIACFGDTPVATGGLVLTDGKVSSVSPASAWHEYNFSPQSSSFTGTYNNDTGGSNYVENVITVALRELTTDKLREADALRGSDVRMIVKDNNGRYWLFGWDNPLYVSGGGYESGTAYGDFSGLNLELTSGEKNSIYEITEEAMAAILNPTPAP